jgi:5'-nucleotidase
MQRRSFLKNIGALSATGFLGQRLFANATNSNGLKGKLVVLHTNDVHSRLEAFPMDGSRNQGLGGVAERATVIKNIRAQNDNVLLLDAGDIFQGTPYFNIYKGEPEIKAMTEMGYEAATIGNHDFDAGIENFANQLKHASFPIVNCNYNVQGTVMEEKMKTHVVIKKGNLKIGITGVGIELEGLVPTDLAGGITYEDPINKLNATASHLKFNEKCDLVICLSHLGYKYGDNKISDVKLAPQTEYVDLIIGGHTHTFLNAPEVIKNKLGGDVVINQVGFAGIQLGRLDYELTKNKKNNLVKSHNIVIEKKNPE